MVAGAEEFVDAVEWESVVEQKLRKKESDVSDVKKLERLVKDSEMH